jgi:hypothetical protein
MEQKAAEVALNKVPTIGDDVHIVFADGTALDGAFLAYHSDGIAIIFDPADNTVNICKFELLVKKIS